MQGAQCPVTRLQSISRTGESEDTCAGLYPELMLQEDGSVYSFSLIKSPNLDWSVYCFKECSSNIANFLQHKILTEGYYTYLLTQFSLNVFRCSVTCVYKYVYTSTVRISNSIHDPKLCLMIARLCSPRPDWSSTAVGGGWGPSICVCCES